MKNNFFILFFILIFSIKCNSQNMKDKKLINRKPVVAGQFYSGTKQELTGELNQLFAKAVKKQEIKNPRAIISPHAGYVFSGEVAASGFNQIDPNVGYENIFVIGSSHSASYEGASIYSQGNYETPLGIVKVNIDLAEKLINENECINFIYQAHQSEHSLEVQIPFLQYRLKKDFQIIPIIIGTQNHAVCKELAAILQPYFDQPKNLFVISTDFSHYPCNEDAQIVDKKTARAILNNSPIELEQTLNENKKQSINNLATSLCGWSSVLTLLYMTENNQEITTHSIQYQNSSDSPYGDIHRVVGYYSIVFSQEQNNNGVEFSLTEDDKKTILKIARTTIQNYIATGKKETINPENLSEELLATCGAFVSLHKKGKLRGCIGRFSTNEPLYKLIQDMVIASAMHDSRFSPVTVDELPEIEIEVSVLTPLKKINSIDEFELGRHGIYIKQGYQSGTLLPQVARQTGWSTEQFLGYCSRDKAHLGWEGWKTAELYIYEAIIFNEE